MKILKMIFALITVILFGSTHVNAAREVKCLDIIITATYQKAVLRECNVTLIQDNIPIHTILKPNKGSKFRLTLKSNVYYTIIIESEGFHHRRICINTAIPDSVSLSMIYEFFAKVEMIPLSVPLSREFDDHPVAVIEYDNKKDVFNINKQYTKNVKKVMFKPESLFEEQGVTPEYNYTAK